MGTAAVEAFGRGLAGGSAQVSVNMGGLQINGGSVSGGSFHTGTETHNSTTTPVVPPTFRLAHDDIETLIRRVTETMQGGNDAEIGANIEERLRRLGGGSDGATTAGGATVENEERHRELLQRLSDLYTAVNQFQNPDGVFQETVRTTVKDSMRMQRNFDDSGENLADRFESANEGDNPKTPTSKPAASTRSSLSPSSKAHIFHEMMSAQKPSEIIRALEFSGASMLGSGVLEHMESLIILFRELQSGDVSVPAVNTGNLEEFIEVHANEKFCDALGTGLFLHEGCFVSVSANDTGDVDEDGDQVRSEVLQNQRVPCCVGQSLELLYKDDMEAVIDFNSVTVTDSTPTLNLVFAHVCSDSNLAKCIINAPVDKICKIHPHILQQVAQAGTVMLHFNGCELNLHQIKALASSRSPLIFDNTPIDGMENLLFSGDGDVSLKIAFTQSCSKFGAIAMYASKLQALMIQKVELSRLGYYDSQVDALNDLNNMLGVVNKSSGCKNICLGELVWEEKSIQGSIILKDSWLENESINLIAELGGSGSETDHEPKNEVATKPDVSTEPQNLEETVLLSGKDGPFTLPHGTTKTLDNGTVVELLSDPTLDGTPAVTLLLYTFADGTTKQATVPRKATAKNFWCQHCGNNSCGIASHKA
jgi:hypothetical protein